LKSKVIHQEKNSVK